MLRTSIWRGKVKGRGFDNVRGESPSMPQLQTRSRRTGQAVLGKRIKRYLPRHDGGMNVAAEASPLTTRLQSIAP
jgi:hypothetical protein